MRTLPTTRARLVGGLALAACLATGLSACGGDDEPSGSADDSSATTDASAGEDTEAATEVTEEDFVTEVNAVCEADYPDINAVGMYLDPADPDTVTTDFLPLVEGLQSDMEAVEAPESLAADYAAALELQQGQLDAITADPNALFSMDPTPINDMLDALGLTSCGTASSDIEPSA